MKFLHSVRLFLLATLALVSIESSVSAVLTRTTTDFPPPLGFGFVGDGIIFPGSKYADRPVTEVRIFWDIEVNPGHDAANINASYLSPVLYPGIGFANQVAFNIDGANEGWSGAGTFSYTNSANFSNMRFGPEGTFWSIQALGLPIDQVEVLPGSRVEIDYLASEGDFNDDGLVDLSDYTTWRNNLGATGLEPYAPGDGNGDGSVTTADYQVWKQQFGTSIRDPALRISESVAVPEPSAFGLAAILSCMFFTRRR